MTQVSVTLAEVLAARLQMSLDAAEGRVTPLRIRKLAAVSLFEERSERLQEADSLAELVLRNATLRAEKILNLAQANREQTQRDVDRMLRNARAEAARIAEIARASAAETDERLSPKRSRAGGNGPTADTPSPTSSHHGREDETPGTSG